MSKIIFFNQCYLAHPAVKERLASCAPEHDWEAMLGTLKFYPRTANMYCRGGQNVLPFRTDICDMLDARIPTVTHDQDSFSVISDHRCQTLWQQHQHRPWIIGWSGGIDSTVIMTSIVRNLRSEQYKNITVACNPASVYEYPWFFKNIIVPNFKTVDSSVLYDPAQLEQSLVINGEPADQLFPGVVVFPLIHKGVDLGTNMFDHPQGIISYLEETAGKRFAQWFYQQTTTNIKSTGLDLTSYFDFFWWVSFNFNWTGILLRSIRDKWTREVSARIFQDQFVGWFNYGPYQTWALAHRRSLAANHVGDYKRQFKDYIYELTGDSYYHKFKTKTSSTSVRSTHGPWVAIQDDWSLLTQDQMGKVLDLLPEHVEK